MAQIELIPVVFLALSCCCLAAIGIRQRFTKGRVPLFGGILSNYTIELDAVEKRLAKATGIFFLLFIGSAVLIVFL